MVSVWLGARAKDAVTAAVGALPVTLTVGAPVPAGPVAAPVAVPRVIAPSLLLASGSFRVAP